MQLIQELRWRGLIHDIMPGTEEQLNKEMTTGYIGFDPTADSLHIGSLVPIFLLVHLQKAGHKPIALIGGATGMVGDPSFKSNERIMLSEEVLQNNQAGIKQQLQKFLDFDESKANAALMVNNYDWFKGISFLDFIRDTGKHITVNYMMAKDSVKKRIEGESGISFTEFTYQLIQGYDFYWLYQNHNCKLQMGGSDQWGNMTTGTELVRRKASGEAFVFTCPLLTKSDGGKFGKSEQGNIWLDANRTTPYQFYQFWLKSADEDATKWIKIFTFLPQQEIEALTAAHNQDAAKRLMQKTLAKELTIFVHGEAAYNEAVATTDKLFANATAPAESMSIADLEALEGVTKFSLPAGTIAGGIDVISLLFELTIFPSKGDARKFIKGGGLSINRKKIEDVQLVVDNNLLLHDKYLLIQRGKNNYYLVKVGE